MKTKVIPIIGPKQIRFTEVIAAQFGIHADTELRLIHVLIKLDMFQPFHLDKYTRAILQREMNVPYSTMTSSLRRLGKAGIVNKIGKNVYFNPGFRDLDKIDAIVFKSTEKAL